MTVPTFDADVDVLTAALAYARVGWYVVPVRRGTKHPGSVLGDRWQHQSSRDPETIVAWFAGTDHGVALHVGRSGAVVFDVDDPPRMPAVLSTAIKRDEPPYQSTRTSVESRGHYLYAAPPDRQLGNSVGKLGRGWGEVRGRNGVIIACPSEHEKAATGGRYRWLRAGAVPVLPDDLAELLPDATEAVDAATDFEIRAFVEQHTEQKAPRLLSAVLRGFHRELDAGGSRHDAMITAACWAAREVRAGAYSAQVACGHLRAAFIESLKTPRAGSTRTATESMAAEEFAGIAAWAVGQAETAELADVRRRIEQRVPDFDVPPPPEPPEEDGDSRGGDSQDEEDASSSWEPIDLSPYLDGTFSRPEPGILYRDDGIGLLYPGRVHWAHGESESGKSMVAQIATVTVIRAGGQVLYLDHESDPGEITARLLALGADPADILTYLVYIRPDESSMVVRSAQAFERLMSQSYELAVVDGVTDALGLDQASSKDLDEVAAWMRRMPRTIAKRTGAAVIAIDHVTKDSGSRGRFAIGSQAKLAGIDGAAFVVEPAKPLGKGLIGEIVLRIAKDRPGSLRRYGGEYRSDRTQEIARITFDSIDPQRIQVTISGPKKGDPSADGGLASSRPTTLMSRVSTVLHQHPGPGLTSNAICDRVKGKREAKLRAIEILVSEGFVERTTTTKGSRTTYTHRSIRVYPEPADLAQERTPGALGPGSP
ncbi:MAG: bifunctional DNA primase/polymerase [Pseudonocardiales bacterium]|nr:bifunctional DNA primase/polymerase [Pseudonocardiales bacterium]MBV9030547.1 bifunctional DNA primase/polymerase [Pseudonocardiales bacterium]